jgi:hypothetical protein
MTTSFRDGTYPLPETFFLGMPQDGFADRKKKFPYN